MIFAKAIGSGVYYSFRVKVSEKSNNEKRNYLEQVNLMQQL